MEYGPASGESIFRVMIEELGGLRVIVPTLKGLEIEERDRRIVALFDGQNHVELAERFRLSCRQVRRIIQAQRGGV